MVEANDLWTTKASNDLSTSCTNLHSVSSFMVILF